MTEERWSYMFRMLKRNPERIPMDRLGEYIRLFAELLGTENEPIFKGIKKASTGVKAKIKEDRLPFVQARLRLVNTDEASKPAKVAAALELMLGKDGIREAQLLDSSENIVYLFHAVESENEDFVRVYQEGTVDGIVTGLVGADDTMHLHLRGPTGQDFRLLVRDEELAREILGFFRKGPVRVTVQGTWIRSGAGWHPEASKCTVRSFYPLDLVQLSSVFSELADIPENGWKSLEQAEAFWREIRGIN